MFILIEAKVGSGSVGVTGHGNQNEEIPINRLYKPKRRNLTSLIMGVQ